MFEHFSLKRRVGELEESLGKLQRDHKALELEWQNTLDKLNHIVGRINKRSALLSQEKEDALMGQSSVGEDGTAGAGPPLSPKAALIQRQILQRRQMLNNGGK